MFDQNIVDALKINVEIVIATLIGVILIIWLVLRPIRLWYWKRSEEVKLLKSIDEKLSQKSEETNEVILPKPPLEEPDITTTEPTEIEVKNEEYICEKKDREDDETTSKGKVYTEEELYEIIKF